MKDTRHFVAKRSTRQKKSTYSIDKSLIDSEASHALLDQLIFVNKQHQETLETTPKAHFQETKSKVEAFLSKLRDENEKLLQSRSYTVDMEPSQEEESFIEMNIFVDHSLGQLVKDEEEACIEKPLVEEIDNRQ
ncbi:hypothetical protein GpartN1_g5191.t1 [Galdieria partita]|uniref:Uncharacterized protein n=1 Tax=Galdieria partita TaxID=83374 RepID=A0A9C7UN06_9RHOD|nr:hypothetical protein GpartN1_g1009.t1 [Galdieria partita]GJQ13400.1 hypothetical protein GpartN1_g5191.t1 [Galdieria partita]